MAKAGTPQFGKYRLFERISSGGKAELWRALRQGGDRFVAIKRLRPSLAKDRELQAMFVREAKVAVQLTHPNIPRVYDLGLVDGDFYIELEHLPGANLRTLLDRCDGNGLPHDLAALVAAELCDALDHLHRKAGPTGTPLQLVHREVAPDNSLVTFEGRVALIDFSGATGMAPLAASPYLSPEQLHASPTDRRSDVFSLSALLYEALTGRRPFNGPATAGSKELPCCRPVLPPRNLRPRLPADLERIVLTGLEHDRARRYQWASEMGTALRGYLARQPRPPDRAALRELMHKLFAPEASAEAVCAAELARLVKAASGAPAQRGHGEGFDFEIDESLMQQVVPDPEAPPEDADGPAPTIVVPVTLPPGTEAPARQPAPEAPPAMPAASVDPASKRKAKRWRIAVPVRGVWGTDGKMSNGFGASLVNLSTTGAMLRLDADLPIPVGGAVGFTLPLKLHNMIALEGVVRWSKQSARGRELGIEFSVAHPELLKLHRVK